MEQRIVEQRIVERRIVERRIVEKRIAEKRIAERRIQESAIARVRQVEAGILPALAPRAPQITPVAAFKQIIATGRGPVC